MLPALLAAGCDPGPPTVFELGGPPRILEFVTYEASGQVVHPDVIRGQGRKDRYWMVLTPYPDAYEKWENPSVYRSRDGILWEEPEPLVNPVVPRPPFDHNCDPDLIRTDGLFHLFYLETQRREYRPDSLHFQDLRVCRSRDGVEWTEPETVVRWDLDTDPFYLSPSVVRAPDGRWRVYLVHPRTRSVPWLPIDLETAGEPAGVLDYGIDGLRPWHVDVFPVDGGWVALLCARGPGARNDETEVWIGASPDLERWRFRVEPLLSRWDSELGVEIVYRSSGLVEDGRLAVWYSGRTPEGTWVVGVATFDGTVVTDLLPAN